MARICLFVLLFGAAGLQAQELDQPLRAVHLSGNWGGTSDAVRLWEEDRTRPLRSVEIPLPPPRPNAVASFVEQRLGSARPASCSSAR